MQFDPWVGKIPWRRKWHPTLVFLPGKSHGQRSLAGSVRHDWTQSEGNTGALTVLSELRSWTTGIQYPFLHFEEHSKPSSQDVKSTKCPEDLWDSYWWSCSAPQVGPSMRRVDWWGMTPCGQHSISFSRITSNGFSRMAVPNSRCWLGYQGSLANHGLEPCVWAYEWTPTHLCFNHNATSGLASKVPITLCISGHWPLVSHLSPLQTPCCTSDTSLAVAIPICPRI